MLSRHSVSTHQGNELTHNSSGNTRPQSSQLAEPLWTDPSIKNGISVRELSPLYLKIFFFKAQAENESPNLPSKSSLRKKKPPPTNEGKENNDATILRKEEQEQKIQMQ